MDAHIAVSHPKYKHPYSVVQSLELLKKSLSLPSNFPDLENVWKIETKSGKMVKSLEFFFKATTGVL